jgi:hypothetical protein
MRYRLLPEHAALIPPEISRGAAFSKAHLVANDDHLAGKVLAQMAVVIHRIALFAVARFGRLIFDLKPFVKICFEDCMCGIKGLLTNQQRPTARRHLSQRLMSAAASVGLLEMSGTALMVNVVL